jgi:hypothetical protein
MSFTESLCFGSKSLRMSFSKLPHSINLLRVYLQHTKSFFYIIYCPALKCCVSCAHDFCLILVYWFVQCVWDKTREQFTIGLVRNEERHDRTGLLILLRYWTLEGYYGPGMWLGWGRQCVQNIGEETCSNVPVSRMRDGWNCSESCTVAGFGINVWVVEFCWDCISPWIRFFSRLYFVFVASLYFWKLSDFECSILGQYFVSEHY